MRIALLTLEALASAAPVRRFVASHPNRIAIVALSDPYRPQRGGMLSQAWRLLSRSGPRLLPYLITNFELPRLARFLPQRHDLPEATPMATLCAQLHIRRQAVDDRQAARQ
jgi:methionyl-tRNA formyltransferase